MTYYGRFSLRSLAALIIILFLFAPLHAEKTPADPDAENAAASPLEIVSLDLSEMEGQESADYAFVYGLTAMYQEKCRGAILTFDAKEEYIAGWLSPDAPDDFCTRISPTTLSVAEILPAAAMNYIYTLFGDRLSLSTLMNREDEAYVCVVMFEPDDDAVVAPAWLSDAENAIKNAAVAAGINPDEFFSILAENGTDKETALALVASGESKASELALSVLKLRNEKKKNSSKGFLESFGLSASTVKLAAAGLVIGVAAVLVLYIIVRLFTPKTVIEENTDTEPSEEENND